MPQATKLNPIRNTRIYNLLLLTKAIRLPSGDQEGTLMVPCPP